MNSDGRELKFGIGEVIAMSGCFHNKNPGGPDKRILFVYWAYLTLGDTGETLNNSFHLTRHCPHRNQNHKQKY